MIVTLKNASQVLLRLLQTDDEKKLADYFDYLSPATIKRFGPHPFDASTLHQICSNLEQNDTQRYVAETLDGNQIVAYMLIKKGILEKDMERLRSYEIHTSGNEFTFAPSIADAWQSSGLGSTMFEYILENLSPGKIILWGGVQASNERAVNFYTKFRFYKVGTFEDHNGVNYDMIREPV